MLIALLSGTANTCGGFFLTKALDAGHKVAVLTRNPAKLSISEHPNLTIVQGDATDPAAVDKLITRTTDAVVNALGSRVRDDVCSKNAPILVPLIKERAPNARFITITSLGCGDSLKHTNYFTWGVVNLFLAKPIADKNIQEQHILDSGLKNWIIVRPGGLQDKPATGKIIADEKLGGGFITREDVGQFCLDNLVDTKWVGKGVGLANAV